MSNTQNHNALAPFGNERLQLWKTIPIDATEPLNNTFDLIVPTDPSTLVMPEVVWLQQDRATGTYQTSPVLTLQDSSGNALASTLTVGTSTNQGKFVPIRPTSGSYVSLVTGGESLQLKITTAGVGQATASRARADGVATIVTGAAHGLLPGDKVRVLAVGGTGYNGLQTVVSVPTTTSFTYENSGADESTATDTGGSVGIRHFIAYVFGLYF